MYRYEITDEVHDDIIGVISSGKSPFSRINGVWSVDETNAYKKFSYYKPLPDDEWVKDVTLDNICQDLYSEDFADKSTKVLYEQTDIVQLKQVTSLKGIPKVAMVKPDGDDFISIVSHEFTTKTSWYTASTRVTGETLTGSDVGPYSSANEYWIDMTSGNVPDEDIIGKPYFAKIYDNGTLVDESDYTIDYVTGKVTFNQSPTGPVTADYSYANNSVWILKPNEDKKINIQHAELDFTIDATITKTYFDIWAYNPLFNPANPVDPEDPEFDPKTEDPQSPSANPLKFLASRRTYKNIKDVVKVANQIEVVDALAGIGQKLVRAVFDYPEIIEMKYSQGTELRIKIDNDQPFTGEFSSVTVYTTIEDEET